MSRGLDSEGEVKTIRDAVHGDLQLTTHELGLVDTAVFQRLRGIKQLGTSSLVYPSAVHTRFEHSLGTAWITKRLLASLERSGDRIDADDARSVVLAGLLHDITHVPFGHTFEDERRLLAKHDQDRARLDAFLVDSPLGERLDQTPGGSRARDLLFSRDIGPACLRQLVTGTVCADLLDYLKRDAYHCGLRLVYDERLLDYFAIVDGQLVVRLHKHGGIRQDVLSELVNLLQLRYTLTERVYYHHAKVIAGAMISRSLELALRAGRMTTVDLYRWRDDSLLDHLASLAVDVVGLADLMDDLACRRLYRRVYMVTGHVLAGGGIAAEDQERLAVRYHQDAAGRAQTERALADELGVPESHVIIYCPSPAMQLKEADVLVETAPGAVAPLSSLEHPDVSALSAKHRGLWRFYVLLRRTDERVVGRAEELCARTFGYPNQLHPAREGRLSFPMP
jgi:HD superfamily phosphohydrolase